MLFSLLNTADSLVVSHFLGMYFTFVVKDLCVTLSPSNVSFYVSYRIDSLLIESFQERDVRRQVNAGKGDFVWGPSICRKRLRHFQSFTRNGITISVRQIIFLFEIGFSPVLKLSFCIGLGDSC